MVSEKVIKNIVIVGSFNSLELDKYFFIKNSIFSEDEISQANLLPGGQSGQLVTKKFIIVFDPTQIIITSLKPNEVDEIDDISKKVINGLSVNCSLKALGINFHILVHGFDSPLHEVTRKLFYSEKNILFSETFNTEDSMFGVYASKDFKDSRLKLDVKPSILQEVANPFAKKDGIVFFFNFHFDLMKKSKEQLLSYLNDFSTYEKESEIIVSKY